VGHPQIAAFARLADAGAQPTRRIEGQKTLMARTMHAITYDAVHDEIIVPQAFSQAILTFRGGANGEEAPIRVIQGSRTGLLMADTLDVDPIHNEIFVPERGNQEAEGGGWIQVFARDAVGNVGPIRKLAGPNTGLRGFMRVTVDPVHDLIFVTGAGGLRIFNRTDSGDVKPQRIIIGGPKSGTRGPGGLLAVYPPTRMVVATTSKYGPGGGGRFGGGEAGNREPTNSFVGAWSIDDNGDVPPRWTIAHDILKEVRGVALDPKNKSIMVSDKGLEAIMTFSFPEIF
jgi:hypothetical protein